MKMSLMSLISHQTLQATKQIVCKTQITLYTPLSLFAGTEKNRRLK